jgi:hypothetical protein
MKKTVVPWPLKVLLFLYNALNHGRARASSLLQSDLAPVHLECKSECLDERRQPTGAGLVLICAKNQKTLTNTFRIAEPMTFFLPAFYHSDCDKCRRLTRGSQCRYVGSIAMPLQQCVRSAAR